MPLYLIDDIYLFDTRNHELQVIILSFMETNT